jgi:hypothetical protein
MWKKPNLERCVNRDLDQRREGDFTVTEVENATEILGFRVWVSKTTTTAAGSKKKEGDNGDA